MLPKDGGQLLLKHRPITSFVLLWRVYLGARWQQIQSWQESFVHRWVCGARKGQTMSEVELLLFLDIEQAQVNGDESPILFLFLGLHKVFRFNASAPSCAGPSATAVCWTHACSEDRQFVLEIH